MGYRTDLVSMKRVMSVGAKLRVNCTGFESRRYITGRNRFETLSRWKSVCAKNVTIDWIE